MDFGAASCNEYIGLRYCVEISVVAGVGFSAEGMTFVRSVRARSSTSFLADNSMEVTWR